MADNKNDKKNEHNWKLYLLIGLAFLMFLPTNGCGGGKKTDTKPPSQPQQTQQQQQKPEAPKQEPPKTEAPKQEAPKPEPPPPPKEESPKEKAEKRIKSKIREYVGDYKDTNIDSITVNEDLGTEQEDDYVVLVHLTWNVANSGKTSKEVITMYSEDMAARMYREVPEAQEVCIFWKVPHLGGSAKLSFERKNGGAYYTDKMFDKNFNKGLWD